MLKYKVVKVLRVISASLALLLFSAIFLLPEHSLGEATYFQVIPTAIRGMTIPGLFAIAASFILLVLTYFFGRLYCSFICPLGIAQDVIIRLRSLIKRTKKPKTISINHRRLRYSILALVFAAIFAGIAIPLGLLEPFAIFGRFISAVIKPFYIFINNKIVNLEWFETLYPLDYNPFSIALLITASTTFLVIATAAILKGRLFCNTLCPVGTLLGLFSKCAWFKMTFNPDLCTKCGKCTVNCKSNCIDYKNYTVDNERCVSCFNCVSACREGAMNYIHSNSETKSATDLSRRDFLSIGASTVAGATLLPPLLRTPGDSRTPVMPPGADNFDHFTSKCTACQLCISNCPSGVLKPASLQYGLSGFLQPRLDFDSGMCEFACTACSNICPNGALKPLTEKKKKYVQIGIVKFSKERCVVVTDKTYCGACGEHCPTGAIQMVELASGLTLPHVEPEVCIGCGACEYICPASPRKAMIVSGLKIHGTAVEAEDSEPAINHLKGKDFPF